MRKLFVVYVEYGPKNREKNFPVLGSFLGRVFPKDQPTGFVVDNSRHTPKVDLGFLKVLSGSNAEREFSGWQEGIEKVQSPSDNDIFCLCNDTFATNYGSDYLSWFSSAEVERALSQGKAIGYMDRYHRPMVVMGYLFDRYLRTSMMLIRWKELKKACPLNKMPVAESEIFAPSGPSLFLPNAPLAPRLRQLLDCWLWKGPAVSGEFRGHWHSAEPLTDESRPRLQEKCRSILLEFLFSALLRSAGVELFDVRKARARSHGVFWMADRLGLLIPIQNFKARIWSNFSKQ